MPRVLRVSRIVVVAALVLARTRNSSALVHLPGRRVGADREAGSRRVVRGRARARAREAVGVAHDRPDGRRRRARAVRVRRRAGGELSRVGPQEHPRHALRQLRRQRQDHTRQDARADRHRRSRRAVGRREARDDPRSPDGPFRHLSLRVERRRRHGQRAAARIAETWRVLPVQQLGLQRGRDGLREGDGARPLRCARERPREADRHAGLRSVHAQEVGRSHAIDASRVSHEPLHARHGTHRISDAA